MKRGKVILAAALILGVCMFFCSRYLLRERTETMAMPQEQESLLPELEWLRQWLGLDEAQFEKVRALHLAYRPKCQSLCLRAEEADLGVQAVMRDATQQAAPALRKRAEIQAECQEAMLEHVRQTAACMNETQARQYLETMLPHVLGLRLPRADGQARPH